jgi:hypothetical protein
MNFSGMGARLSGEDFGRAAAAIGCKEAAIVPVFQVEARGSDFDSQNRPVILSSDMSSTGTSLALS